MYLYIFLFSIFIYNIKKKKIEIINGVIMASSAVLVPYSKKRRSYMTTIVVTPWWRAYVPFITNVMSQQCHGNVQMCYFVMTISMTSYFLSDCVSIVTWMQPFAIEGIKLNWFTSILIEKYFFIVFLSVIQVCFKNNFLTSII